MDSDVVVDAKTMGGIARCYRGASRRTSQSTGQRDAHTLSERKSPVVYRRGVLQRGWQCGEWRLILSHRYSLHVAGP